MSALGRHGVLRVARETLFYLAVLVTVAFFAFPLFWMLLKSLHYTRDIVSYEPRFVAQLTLVNYVRAVSEPEFVRYFRNSVLYSLVASGITVLITSMGAYVVAKTRRRSIAIGILAIRMAPLMVYLIPTFFALARMGATRTWYGPLVGYMMLTVPPATWLLTGFFETIEPAFEEAATVDGATHLQAFFLIVLPQVVPGMVAVFVLAFAQVWNNLIVSLVLSGPGTQTLPLMISRMQTFYDPNMGKIVASANLTTLPVLILIVIARKHVIATFQRLDLS